MVELPGETMTRPLLLDLFCGAGGAAMGYHRAGFDVVGVDIKPQPRYPFEFRQGDALQVPWDDLIQFDAIHASPPCQAYSRMRHLPWLKDKVYPDMIPATRKMLETTDVPWIIENVEDAPLERASTLFGGHGVWLCGQMFGLPLYRHRAFETTFPVAPLAHPRHQQTILGGRLLNKRYSQTNGVTGVIPIVSVAGNTAGMMRYAPAAMGIDWMRREELTQAVPPAYTEFIGEQLLSVLRGAA